MGSFSRRLQAVRFHFGWRLLLGGGGRGGDEGLARTRGGDRAADEVVESSYAYPAELWYNT